MTKAMEAGRELDAVIEEKLFGHRIEVRYCNWLPGGWYEVQSYGEERISGGLLDEDELHPCYLEGEKWVIVPFYSTDISDAWRIVERFSRLKFRVDLLVIPGDKEITYYCNICPNEIGGAQRQTGVIPGNSISEAICRAALLAKPGQKQEVK